ncbi:hypothetical protein GCM10011608_10910 [Micromonospora sonchi]|uniref:Uncharacterized protein n=1 Tax=Micromonospora sonchi TaxID=1763543 RepID=A0A917TMD7_9ACTN|nr:hypothetical protein [Micromonospora sonchi]GGM27896.1 hypothetical protein GCM10011608_10910 [Micromonospora sonchi]
MSGSPRIIRVDSARAVVGGVVHEAPPIATPGVTVDPDGTVRDTDGTPLARLTAANPDTPPALGVFRSESGRTELTVTEDGRLDIRLRLRQDVLTDKDVAGLRWALDRYEQVASERRGAGA